MTSKIHNGNFKPFYFTSFKLKKFSKLSILELNTYSERKLTVSNPVVTRGKGLKSISLSRAPVVHLNFRAGSTFPVPVCTVSPRHWLNKAGTQ